MKKIIIIIIAIIGFNGYSQDKQIQWESDFTKARMLSKNQNKPILMYFTNNLKSEESRLITSHFFNSKTFEKISSKFIFIQVNISDNSTENERLNVHYNKVNTFPSLVLLDSNGNILGEALNKIAKENINSFFNVLQSKLN